MSILGRYSWIAVNWLPGRGVWGVLRNLCGDVIRVCWDGRRWTTYESNCVQDVLPELREQAGEDTARVLRRMVGLDCGAERAALLARA